MTTQLTPGALVRIAKDAVLGADMLQMILYRAKRDYPPDWQPSQKKLRPLAFCRTRKGLLLAIKDHGIELIATGTSIVESLGDDTFEPEKAASEPAPAREMASAGQWMDRD